jgi:hypothetical protein
MSCRVALVGTDVSEERSASIIGVTRIVELMKTLAVTSKRSMLQRNTIYYHYYTILCYTILYYTILYYTTLYYTILHYTILLVTHHHIRGIRDNILYYTMLYYTILYYAILYYTILYYTILYYNILYYIILFYTIPTYAAQRTSVASCSLCCSYFTDSCHPDEGCTRFRRNVGSYKSHTA